MNLGNCTCGSYMSVIPPEPCPIHDPERAYWRMKLLQEFGGHYTTTTTSTIPKYTAPVPPKPPIHHLELERGGVVATTCEMLIDSDNAQEEPWTRTPEWVTCVECRKTLDAH